MKKKIAVLIRERQEEGLRMALGLTLKDDSVDIFVLDSEVEDTERNRLNLETLALMKVKISTNISGSESYEFIANNKLADKLVEYDHVITY